MANMVHDLTALPSTSTVHAPQIDVSQPMCGPVNPRTSRRKCMSNNRGSTSWVCFFPLMLAVIDRFMRSPSSGNHDTPTEVQVIGRSGANREHAISKEVRCQSATQSDEISGNCD